MKLVTAALLVLSLTLPQVLRAEVAPDRAQQIESLRLIRDFGKTLGPQRTAGIYLTAGGVLSALVQVVGADAIYGQAAFPMVIIG